MPVLVTELSKHVKKLLRNTYTQIGHAKHYNIAMCDVIVCCYKVYLIL